MVYPLEALSRAAAKSSSLCLNLDMSKPYAGYMCYMEVAQATGRETIGKLRHAFNAKERMLSHGDL